MHESAAISTDNHLLCVAFASFSPETVEIKSLMIDFVPMITIQWITDYCEITGSELVDRAAKDATNSTGVEPEISFSGVCA